MHMHLWEDGHLPGKVSTGVDTFPARNVWQRLFPQATFATRAHSTPPSRPNAPTWVAPAPAAPAVALASRSHDSRHTFGH